MSDKMLVLHIEVPGFNADNLDQCAVFVSGSNPPTPKDRLFVVVEEWMREEVGITLVSRPGEKEMAEDFEVHAYTGRIVGAEVRDSGSAA